MSKEAGRTFRVAVVGATGLVGETMIQVLEERGFPVSELYPLASNRSLGKTRRIQGRGLSGRRPRDLRFQQGRHRPVLGRRGSLARVRAEGRGRRLHRHRQHLRVPLPGRHPAGRARSESARDRAVQEPRHHRQPELLDDPDGRGAEADPRPVGIERINVATYQSVSGAGREAVEELASRPRRCSTAAGPSRRRSSPKQIAFNGVPQIDKFQDNGYTKEEMKMVWETRKIMEDETIRVNATAVRVPVFIGHSEAVHIETRRKITAAQARALLEKAPGVKVLDEPRRAGIQPRLPRQRTATQFMSGEYVKIFPRNEDLTYGSSRTTCARALPRTASRSPRFWCASIFKLYCRPILHGLAKCGPRVCF